MDKQSNASVTARTLNGAKGKLPVEQFVIQAIERLRLGPGKPVHIRRTGLDKAFKAYFGEEIHSYLEILEAEGAIKRTWGGTQLYTAGDWELKMARKGDEVLKRILGD